MWLTSALRVLEQYFLLLLTAPAIAVTVQIMGVVRSYVDGAVYLITVYISSAGTRGRAGRKSRGAGSRRPGTWGRRFAYKVLQGPERLASIGVVYDSGTRVRLSFRRNATIDLWHVEFKPVRGAGVFLSRCADRGRRRGCCGRRGPAPRVPSSPSPVRASRTHHQPNVAQPFALLHRRRFAAPLSYHTK